MSVYNKYTSHNKNSNSAYYIFKVSYQENNQESKTFATYDFSKSSKTWHKLGSRTITVPHKEDGTQTLKLTGTWSSGFGSSTSYTPASISLSGSITLPTIPRASLISSASNITLGETCNIKWTPANKNFKYKLKFTLGAKSITTGDYILPNTTNSYTYQEQILSVDDFAPQITTSTKGTMTAYLYTYNSNGTQVGSAQSKTFQVTVPNTLKPELTMDSTPWEFSNTTDFTDRYGEIGVRDISKIKFNMLASVKEGATVVKYIISGDYNKTIETTNETYSHTMETPIIKPDNVAETAITFDNTFQIKVVDSRGYESNSVSVKTGEQGKSIYNYHKPKIDVFRGTRDKSNVSTVGMVWMLNWTSIRINNEEKNVLNLSIDEGSTNISKESGCHAMAGSKSISNVTNSPHTYTLTVVDTFGNSDSCQILIPSPQVLLDFKSGGTCLGIGRMVDSSDDGLVVAFDSTFEGESTYFYPRLKTTNNVTSVDTSFKTSLQEMHRALFYKPGEQVTLEYYGAGYLLNSGKVLRFQIPLSKATSFVEDCTISINTLKLVVRAENNSTGTLTIYNNGSKTSGYTVTSPIVESEGFTGSKYKNGLSFDVTKTSSFIQSGATVTGAGLWVGVIFTFVTPQVSTNSEDEFYEDETDPTNGDGTENNSGDSINTENNETNNSDSQSTTENTEEENP